MVNLKALGKALVPRKRDFGFILGFILLLVVVGAIGAIAVGAILGFFYVLELFLSKETVEIISWVIFGLFWIWFLFYDIVKARYEKFCYEGNDDVH